MILTLAWISWASDVLCLQDWPRASTGFSEWLWRREQRTTEHTQGGLLPLTGSPPQSFTFMPPMLVATELVRVLLCFCVWRGCTPTANSTPPRPSCSVVWPQRADMKLDTTAGGWQRRLEQLPEPHTPLPSLLFSSYPPALSLIMPSQGESTQQHKHGYIGLYPVLHLRLSTFLHHVLMDNLTCPKKKPAWGHVHSGTEESPLLPQLHT